MFMQSVVNFGLESLDLALSTRCVSCVVCGISSGNLYRNGMLYSPQSYNVPLTGHERLLNRKYRQIVGSLLLSTASVDMFKADF